MSWMGHATVRVPALDKLLVRVLVSSVDEGVHQRYKEKCGQRLTSQMVADGGPQVPEEYLYRVVDALEEIARETAKTYRRSP
jgi:hypothetical protein